MKAKVHIPTEQFGFIEISDIPTSVDAVNVYKKVKKLVEMSEEELKKIPNGLSTKEYAQARKTLLMTGEFDPNLEEECNYQQLRAIKDFNNTLRAIKGEE